MLDALVEEFLIHLSHERGLAAHTARTYQALLKRFTEWATAAGITTWRGVNADELVRYMERERCRALKNPRPRLNRGSARPACICKLPP